MKEEQVKILSMLIAMVLILLAFVSISNEITIDQLLSQQDSLRAEIDSLSLDLTYTNAKIKILEAVR